MQSLFFFLIALALLIVIHEFGHFWVARRCGVKILRFSVGFGRPLWQRNGNDGTEYVLAMLPLGGYVKMLDEREGEVASDLLPQAFNRQPLKSRAAIVAAGPLANLLFAVVAYWLILVIGIPGIKPFIDEVKPDSIAAHAALLSGDQIMQVNGQKTPTWNKAYSELLSVAENGGQTTIAVASGGTVQQHVLQVPKLGIDETASLLDRLGISPLRPQLQPIVGFVGKKGPAARAGIKAGDRLWSLEGKQIDSWRQWVVAIRAHPEQDMHIVIMRHNQPVSLLLKPDRNAAGEGKIGLGVDTQASKIPAAMRAELRYGPIDAIGQAVGQVWSFSSATIKSVAGMLTGTVSTKNIGGPIAIAQIAGSSAHQGFISFVSFLAMISISLGILNLLPVPVLDGGHLAMYLYEWIRGKPLPESAQVVGQRVGILLLLMLMLLAFTNDLSRLFG